MSLFKLDHLVELKKKKLKLSKKGRMTSTTYWLQFAELSALESEEQQKAKKLSNRLNLSVACFK